MTIKDLQAQLKKMGVTFKASAKKADLEKLLVHVSSPASPPDPAPAAQAVPTLTLKTKLGIDRVLGLAEAASISIHMSRTADHEGGTVNITHVTGRSETFKVEDLKAIIFAL